VLGWHLTGYRFAPRTPRDVRCDPDSDRVDKMARRRANAPGPAQEGSAPTQAASSQLLLTGVSTRPFGSLSATNTAESSSIPTLAQYAGIWLTSIDGLVRPSTVTAYSSRLELHVLPELGDRPLDQISVDAVAALIAGLRNRGYSGATISCVLVPLSRLFGHAARRGVIEVSPLTKLDRTERPTTRRRERPVLSRDEIGRLLKAAAPASRTLLATAILSGLRQGELLALHWEDIDFDRQVIHVRSALDRQRKEAPPKTTNALREVVLMPALAEMLLRHRDESRFRELDDYVFTTQVGTPLHWANLSSRTLKPALKRAGIQPLRWHDLRHTFASLLIAGGANITFVSRQLGHSSSQITLGVYAHLLDREEQAQRTREMLEDMLGSIVLARAPHEGGT
jgi:integrase